MQYSTSVFCWCAAAALLCSSPTLAATKAATPAVAASAPQAAAPKPVDINSAPKSELMKLPGIGAAEAQKIIAGRPFLSKARLVTDNILPMAAYEALKGRIVAVQKAQPTVKSKPVKEPKG